MSGKAKFLSNLPSGTDLFDGKSQDKVAEAIRQHIVDTDAVPESGVNQDTENTVPRIIGIEGNWGAGKSNTLLLLKQKLGEGYYIFTYDAWGNQEDLQRRSLLQLLTTSLVKDKKLVGTTHVKYIASAFETTPKSHECSWQDRVDSLSARKSSTHNVTIPTIYKSTKYFALMLVATGIIGPALNAIKGPNMPCWYPLAAFALVLLPAICYFYVMWSKQKELKQTSDTDKKIELRGWSWEEMFQMYQTSGTTETSTWTISEQEPTVTEFREWMTDLSNALTEGLRLIVVFDNMDRLPSEKVRQLWSSIQTFFAEKGYPRVWCIIPFDRKHLANAFNDTNESDEKKKLANYFIEKTFPVVYRIPDPIITDYKVVFDRLFEQAFGKHEEQEVISRCYRLNHIQPNMREIISFINKLVALSNQWGDEVKLSSMALFLLHQDDILKSPESSIVNRDYLKGMGRLFEPGEDLDTEISALTYGIGKQDAAQLPMKGLINQALNDAIEADFADYAKRNLHFYSILSEVIEEMDEALLNSAVRHVAPLSSEGIPKQNADNLMKVWGRLSDLYLKSAEKETAFRDEVRALMRNSTDRHAIGEHFLKLFTDNDNPHKGPVWYHVYKEVTALIKELGVPLTLPEKVLEDSEFVDYLRAAKERYRNYPVKCDNDALSNFCVKQITDGKDVVDVLKLTNGDAQYDFSSLKTETKRLIEEKEATSINFEQVLKALVDLSDEPLNLKLDGNYLAGLKYDGPMRPDYRVLLMLTGKEVAGLGDEDYEAMANVVFRYVPMQVVWEKCQSISTTVLVQLTKYMLEKGIHDEKPTDTSDVLNEMVTIATRTGADRKTIIKYLNNWGRKSLTAEEEKLNFSSVFSNDAWIDAFEVEKNELSVAVLGKFYRDCGTMPTNQFVNASNAWVATNYWAKVLKRVALDEEFWKTLPNNMAELVNHLIEGICSGSVTEGTMEQALLDSLLNHVKFSEVSTKVNEVMDKFTSTYRISLYKFKILHTYMEKSKNHEVVFLNKILTPIIDQEDVQAIILSNIKRYESLLKDNIEQASNLKKKLVSQRETSQNQEWVDMIERLGIVEVEEKGG